MRILSAISTFGALGCSVLSAPADTNHASTGPTWRYSGVWLSSPRASVATAVVGSLAFFAGGDSSSGQPTDTVDIYDDSTDQWTTEHLSEARRFVTGATVANRYAIFAGGIKSPSGNYSQAVDVYDVKTRTWLSPLVLAVPRGSVSAVVVGDKTVLLGGNQDVVPGADVGGMTPSNAVDIIDRDLNVYSYFVLPSAADEHRDITKQPTLSLPALAFSPAVGSYAVGNSTVGVIAGGYYFDYPHTLRPLQRVDARTRLITPESLAAFMANPIDSDLLVKGPALTAPVLDAKGVLAGETFLYAGGRIPPSALPTEKSDQGSRFSANVTILAIADAVQSQWVAQVPQLSEPRSELAAASVANGRYALFAGGLVNDAFGLVTKSIDIFDTTTNQFVGRDQHPGFHIPRSAAAAVVVNDCKVMFAGGWIMGRVNATAAVDIFDMCV
ncbi:hypothetical protein H4R34_003530 [Dimargaris verticillata]|uniref:Galactose oxidase n=1 Tax=Dimargaris verticillata TaxID=2761393 RepID=A0A9W8B0J0_9FUNG|nr:hypothetical protein H4R34_003530 [Dimargaris verticillata]